MFVESNNQRTELVNDIENLVFYITLRDFEE